MGTEQLRTQAEVNQEYSQYATMAGDRAFKLTLVEKQVEAFKLEISQLQARMREISMEKVLVEPPAVVPQPEAMPDPMAACHEPGCPA